MGCLAQGTLQIRFDSPPQLPGPGQGFFVQQYFEAGMWFRPLGVVEPGNGFVRYRGGGQVSSIPDNDTAYLAATFGDSLVFSFANGSAFNLISVDLAEYSTAFQTPLMVPFTGHLVDGGTVTTSFTTDGIIDGDGPLADFETFYFSPEFSNLTRVEIQTPGWSLDNLVLKIPEPTPFSLLPVGALLLGILARRRRN